VPINIAIHVLIGLLAEFSNFHVAKTEVQITSKPPKAIPRQALSKTGIENRSMKGYILISRLCSSYDDKGKKAWGCHGKFTHHPRQTESFLDVGFRFS
jgi:hypothetical protein